MSKYIKSSPLKKENGKMNLSYDVGYCFDNLSILEVKIAKGVCKASELFQRIDEYKKEIGDSLFYEIFSSAEYVSLFTANKDLFEMIDYLRGGQVHLGPDIDELNTKRLRLKNKLQLKFFGVETDEKKNVL